MAGIKSYLTPRNRRELIDFIAIHGENYDRYLQWCDARGIKAFTKAYLHTWVFRKNDRIKQSREEFDRKVRAASTYDREKRIEEMELDMQNLNMLFHGNADNPELVLKIIEMKRKISVEIAKERGEYMKQDKVIEGSITTGASLRQAAVTRLLNVGDDDETTDI